MTDDRELSVLMREAMAAEARQLSASQSLTEQMITQAIESERRSVPIELARRGWQNWVLPVAAAVFVALLVSSVLIGGKLLHSSGSNPASSVGPLPSPTGNTSTSNTSPSSVPTTGTPTGTPTAVPVGPLVGPVPAGFRAVDLTWVSADEGWALGTAPCAKAPCTSIVRTTDGGKSWVGLHAPAAELSGTNGCSDNNCVASLRFANPLVGYAFGPSVLYLTTNGGQDWVKQFGGADALEIGDGTVLRVTGKPADCAGGAGCALRVQRSVIGASSWQDLALPSGGPPLVSVSLVRTGPLAVITTFGHVAGGSQSARSALFISEDDGGHWTLRADPCPSTGTAGEIDTRALASAPDGSLTVLCTPRQAGGAQFTMTSTDGGLTFIPATTDALGAVAGDDALGAASARTLLVGLDGLYRSTDGGQHWSRLINGPSSASYIGFESSTVGRVLDMPSAGSIGSARIWTTTDAGQSWTSFLFK